MECFDAGAERFGWAGAATPARLDARGRLADRLGLRHHLLSHQYRAGRRPRPAAPDGQVRGPDRRPTRSATAPTPSSARRRRTRPGVPVDKVTVMLGDSDLPPATVAGGSNDRDHRATPSSRPARRSARAWPPRGRRPASPFAGPTGGVETPAHGGPAANGAREALERRSAGSPAARWRTMPRICPRACRKPRCGGLYAGQAAMLGGNLAQGPDRLCLRRPIRRGAGAPADPRNARAAGGRRVRGRPIINPLTAHSQLMGGMIWGLSRPCTRQPRSTAARPATSTTTSPTIWSR